MKEAEWTKVPAPTLNKMAHISVWPDLAIKKHQQAIQLCLILEMSGQM